MDGVLLKWTNYLSGWQPRYFVLESGILSYYHSKADINNSCKGSIKVSACDINAHPSDHTRLDVIIPGEAYYYVKASTQQERQVWLVALGTCKAQSYDMTLRLPNSTLSECGDEITNRGENEGPSGEQMLKTKRSELVMYRDLLTQQLYNIKMSLKASKSPSVESINEASALVNVTCESFIATLEDCMQLVDLNSFMRGREGSLSPSCKSKSFFDEDSSWGSQPMTRHASSSERRSIASRTTSEETEVFPSSGLGDVVSVPSSNHQCDSSNGQAVDHSNSPSKSLVVPSSTVASCNNNNSSRVSAPATITTINGHAVIDAEANLELRVPTFFSQMTTSFLDLKLTREMEIPTVQFLDACRCLVAIFDKWNEQAFIIGKLDIVGNIRKIHQKYTSSPETFPTVQRMIVVELRKNEAGDMNSATVALLWLCKSLEFSHELMARLLERDCQVGEMKQLVAEVYEKVLKDYHCWVVRSAFYMILPSMPPLDQLIIPLASDPSRTGGPCFLASLRCDARDYLAGLGSILRLLQSFFDANGLKIKEAEN